MTTERAQLEELELGDQPQEVRPEARTAPNVIVPQPTHGPGSAWRDPKYRNPWLTNPYAEGRSRAIVFGAAVVGVVGVGLPVLNQFVDVSSDVVTVPARALAGSGGSDSPPTSPPPVPGVPPASPAEPATVAAVDRAVQNASAESDVPYWASEVNVQPAITAHAPVEPPPPPTLPPTESGNLPPAPPPPPPPVDDVPTPPPPPSDQNPPPADPTQPPGGEVPPPPEPPTPPDSPPPPPDTGEGDLPPEAQQEMTEEFGEIPAMSQIDPGISATPGG